MSSLINLSLLIPPPILQPAFVLPLVHPREMDVGVWEETQMLSIEVIDGVSSIEGLTLLPHEEITVNEADKR